MGDNGSGAVYSRFADEMDIDTLDLKIRDNYGYGRWGAIKRNVDYHRKKICFVAFAVCLFFVGIVIGHFLHFAVVEHCDYSNQSVKENKTTPAPTVEPAPVSNYSNIVHELINKKTLDTYLKQFTQRPHYAASPNSEQIIADIKNQWSAQGFEVYTKRYKVQLSRPNTTDPTRFDRYGSPGVCCESTYYPNDDPEGDLLPGFNPYGTNIDIEGDLVFINYGTAKDFITLTKIAAIPVEGKICLVRQGKLSIRIIVRNCHKHGGIALVVFPDTLHFAPNITKDVDPNTWWLPVNATIRDPVRMGFGDPLTPFLPSLEYGSVNQSGNASAEQETITSYIDLSSDFPVQAIGYEQARKYLTTMAQPAGPGDEWQGIKLYNHTFRVGPGFENHAQKFRLKINNVKSVQTITNVFGMIKGDKEPDRYVIVGNHRDSLTYGGVEPGTGTACLMELGRVLGGLYEKGWRPRRTVILASWDAGDDGNIGSAEWVEENVEILRERAVAYINLDGAVEGNYSFSATGSPLLSQIIYYATKRVKCPDSTHPDMTVYEAWSQRKFDQLGAEIEALGLGNDAAPFLHVAGVPVLDLKYTYDKDYYGGIPTYPVKHTAFDTYDYVKRFIDPDMSIHAAVTEVVAEALLSLADDPLLNIQVVNYADKLVEYLREIYKKNFVPKPSSKASSNSQDGLGNLADVIQRFTEVAQNFQQKYYIPADKDDETLLRELNDRVMSVDRALTGDPGRFFIPQLRHVVYGPARNGYDGQGFGPLQRALFIAAKRDDWSLVQPALSSTISRIEAAIHLLTDNPLNPS